VINKERGKSRASRQAAKVARMDENQIGKIVVNAAIAVHRELGPGLLESVYEVVLVHELQLRGLDAVRQVSILTSELTS